MSAKFEVPLPPPLKRGEPLAASTQKEYKRMLNQIAAEGFTTPTAILEHKFSIIRIIKERAPGNDENGKRTRRAYLSAVLWILPESFKTSKIFNPFKILFQQSLPDTDYATGNPWKPRNKYHA